MAKVKRNDIPSFGAKVLAQMQSIVFRKGFPGGSVIKNPHANAGDAHLIPGLGRSTR